jgi:hypothetical protein
MESKRKTKSNYENLCRKHLQNALTDGSYKTCFGSDSSHTNAQSLMAVGPLRLEPAFEPSARI